MPQLLALWNGLSLGRKVVVALSTATMFAAVIGLARMASQPDMALLYSGLEPQAAADVIAAIEGRGIPFEVQGGAILVPGAERDALRLTLAGDGLPANTAQGYELLDSLTGFGTTSQMFDAAYWRAKEESWLAPFSPHRRLPQRASISPFPRPILSSAKSRPLHRFR